MNFIKCNLQEPSFIADTNWRRTRFRVIGAMEETVIPISVDYHKMKVIPTDGYLTEPCDVDYLHLHAGERYDFILWQRSDIERSESVFPIRIEAIAVYCKNHYQPERVGIAYLKHSQYASQSQFKNGRCFESCISLNCLRFKFPNTPFAVKSNTRAEGECPYSTIENCNTPCPHSVNITHGDNSKTVKFVLSSVWGGPRKPMDDIITKLLTHPIQMHGHSFWVTIIAYLTYSNGPRNKMTMMRNKMTM
ncbi:laccase-2-like [Paramuricea clavata]|uniref:Laccase-2-like, partial n=1 Tax=Paramuricea clavata TaxID=317549 RepID=A0A7D9KYF6_PARCT|nr:laccase-2-like [Paramuricea clavata]